MPHRDKFRPKGWSEYRPLHKLRLSLRGLCYAATLDTTVKYRLALACGAVLLAVSIQSWLALLVFLGATGLMLVTEILNSALEGLCDYIQPEYDEKIKIIKDMSASGCFVAVLIWWVTLAYVAWRLVETHWL